MEERFLRVYAYGRAVRLHSSLSPLSSSHSTSSFFESNTTFMSTSSHSRGPSRRCDSDQEQINRQWRIGSIALKGRESRSVTLAFELGPGSGAFSSMRRLCCNFSFTASCSLFLASCSAAHSSAFHFSSSATYCERFVP
jgi:hypothetical protein